MKKISIFASGALFGILIMLSSTALGSDIVESITAKFSNSLKVSLDGKHVELKNGALNYNDTNYLSVREVAKAAGLDVNWNEEAQTVELASVSAVEQPGSSGKASEVASDSVFYKREDVQANLRKIYPNDQSRSEILSSVQGIESVLTYGGNEYVTKYNENYFYDPSSNLVYLSESLLLKFLIKDDLNGLNKYSVDIAKKSVSIIR